MLIKDDKILSAENDLVKTFDKHYYVNIVENPCGIKPYYVASANNVGEDNAAIDLIMKFYENHLSIAEIMRKTRETSIQSSFQFSSVNPSQTKLQSRKRFKILVRFDSPQEKWYMKSSKK